MQKNTAGQTWIVYAFQDSGGSNPGEPVTGDAANITGNLYLDGSASANAIDDTNPTELGGGYYAFSVTAAESNADSIVCVPVSSTANVNVVGVPGAVYTTPAGFADGTARVLLANSASHGGSSFVLTGDHITLTSTTEHAISAVTSANGKNGLHLEANGTAGTEAGLYAFGDWTGINAANSSGSTGNGIRATSNGSGAGLDLFSSTGSALLTGTSSGSHLGSDIKADINAEVLDVMANDTFAEPSSVPAATATLAAKLGWLAALSRNKLIQTATTQTLRNDADDADVATAAVSDDGTTATRGEWS